MTLQGNETFASPVAAANSVDSDVEVSPLEARKFRVLTLPNKMQVFLVSDESTDKAATALDVSVGHLSDPWELPGLAHFCEHMLFLGTKKYPDEGSFRKFLSENSGFSNAYTAMENTNYHYQMVVPPNDLKLEDKHHVPRFKESLDRFAQFFKYPLFTETATERELNAVDAEHQKNLQKDCNRQYQLMKSLANPEHPYSKFGTGSKATLGTDAAAAGLDTRKALLAFHSKYYSANLMNLCITGPYALDVLEQWTVELFASIPNHDAPKPCHEYRDMQPLLSDQTSQLIYVDPIRDSRRLEISWLIPSLDNFYRSKPAYYVSHLLGHEGKGSLLSLLKQKGWVDVLATGPVKEVTPYAFFVINMDLTQEGTEKVDDILHLLFGYLRLIRDSGVQEWIFEEMASLAELNFRFQERCEPYNFVQGTSASMCKHPPAHYLSGLYLFRDYKPREIHEVLAVMTPERCNIVQVGKHVKDKTFLVEPWYKTLYGKEPIPADKLRRWTVAKPDPAVAIPPKNMFVPTDLSMLAEPLPRDEKDLEGPAVVEENKYFKLYYKLDRTFNRPKAAVHLDLCAGVAYQSAHISLLAKIFTLLVVDELIEFSYDAEIAGLHYNLYNTHCGLRLVVLGYSHNLGVLVNTILNRIANFKTNPERLRLILDQLRREYINFDKDQAHLHAMYEVSYLLEQPRWHISEYLKELNKSDITAATIDAFVPTLFKRMFAIGMIGGNVSEDWSKDLMRRIQQQIGYSPLPTSEITMRRISKLPRDYEILFRMTHPSPTDNNSAIKVLFQLGPRGEFGRDVTVELLGDMLNRPTFHELRTVQQLGYMVFEGITRFEGVRGLYIIVQSPKVGPDELLVRIRKFLVDVRRDMLETLTEEEFNGYVSSMRALKLEGEKTLFRQTGRYWSEIMRRECVFDREEREAEALQHVTKQDVLDLFDKYIAEEGSERRFLITMVHGNLHERPEKGAGVVKMEGVRRPVVEIENAHAFRNWCPLFPVTGVRLEDIVKVPQAL